MSLLCAHCGTGDDPIHGPVQAKYGITGKGAAHFGCEIDYQYGRYEDWRDTQDVADYEGPDEP